MVSVALAIYQKGRHTMHGTIPKPRKGLSPKTITALVQAAQPGLWTHERGLCLAIARSGAAFWALRYSTKAGKRRLMTLEPYEPIDAAKLKALEWTAAEHRKQIKSGRDPLAERNATIKPATAIRRAADTFEDVALDYIAQHKDGWKGHHHHDQWIKTLATYAYPIIGKMAPHEITTNDVLDVLSRNTEQERFGPQPAKQHHGSDRVSRLSSERQRQKAYPIPIRANYGKTTATRPGGKIT
jgi:hypothetical protein